MQEQCSTYDLCRPSRPTVLPGNGWQGVSAASLRDVGILNLPQACKKWSQLGRLWDTGVLGASVGSPWC